MTAPLEKLIEEQAVLTRKDAVALLNSRGFKVTLDTFRRHPPPSVGKLGRHLYYEHKEVIAWPWRRMKVASQVLPKYERKPKTNKKIV